MARERQLSAITPGEYVATVTWWQPQGKGNIERCAESINIKVEDRWVYLYLAGEDAEPTLRLSRKSNKHAQIYVGMGVEDVVRERIRNRLRNSTRCCYRGEGQLNDGPCPVHTPEWVEEQVDIEAQAMRTSNPTA